MLETGRSRMGLKRNQNARAIRRGGRQIRSPRAASQHHTPRFKARWAGSIPDNEWAHYADAIGALREAGVNFLLGGGFAFAAYTGRWRNTKDIDFYVEPKDAQNAVRALESVGFKDYYPQRPYDRKWIYRSTRSDVIVDIIWAMANQRTQVDRSWFERSRLLSIRGEKLPVLGIEEMIWCKLYILQRDRCDWTDLFNLVFAAGKTVDWERLLRRLEDDRPLLQGMLCVYGWVCPGSARELSRQLWSALRLAPPPPPKPGQGRRRARFLDSRKWFVGTLPADKPLEI